MRSLGHLDDHDSLLKRLRVFPSHYYAARTGCGLVTNRKPKSKNSRDSAEPRNLGGSLSESGRTETLCLRDSRENNLVLFPLINLSNTHIRAFPLLFLASLS